MRRATLRINNRTAYRSDHLRAFAMAARSQVFGTDLKALVVTFVPARFQHSGRASIRGSWSLIRVPKPEHLDKHQLAQLLVHEFAHNDGANGERWMRRSKAFGFGSPDWRSNVAWATDLPLELKVAKAAPPPTARMDAKLTSITTRETAWRSKAKRAANALKKLARQRRYYERKLAAMSAKP